MHRETGRPRCADQDGMTLLEVMVALLVIGLVLSAFASVILSSLRAIVVNEREVRATSLAQEGIEELQSIVWDAAGLYEGEANAAGDEWSDFLAELDGDPVYLTQYSQPNERLPQVPEPIRVYEREDVEYTLRSYVTWIDRSGDGFDDTKLFTAIVTWQDASGSQRQLRSEGTRVPTQSEAPSTSAGVRILSFRVSPDPATLSAENHNNETLRITIRANQAIAASPAPVIKYYTLGDDHDDWVLRTRTLSGSEGNTRWSTTIPSDHNHHRWARGFVDILFVGEDTSDNRNLVEAWSSVRFTGGEIVGPTPKPPSSGDAGDTFPFVPAPAPPEEDPDPDEPYPSEPVSITSVLPQGNICVDNASWALKGSYEVVVQVKGMRDIDNVTVSYNSYDKKNGTIKRTTQDAVHTSGNSESATFKMVIAAGQRLFSPGSSVAFEAHAFRPDGSNALRESAGRSVSSSC